MWEYAIAMCGYLMKICPFDQPDVASAKAVVLDILKEGQPEPDFVQDFIDEVHMARWKCACLRASKIATDVRSALRALWAAFNRAISSRSTRSCRSRARSTRGAGNHPSRRG